MVAASTALRDFSWGAASLIVPLFVFALYAGGVRLAIVQVVGMVLTMYMALGVLLATVAKHPWIVIGEDIESEDRYGLILSGALLGIALALLVTEQPKGRGFQIYAAVLFAAVAIGLLQFNDLWLVRCSAILMLALCFAIRKRVVE
ncbi:MAG: hypothetical protein SGJ20_20135 [Planctomycetota bacterium]|nr:hypothetical protein [Planctomycetota bacterium]